MVTENIEDNQEELTVNFKGGGSLVKLKPLFSNNADLSRSVFVAWKNSVLEYNSKTGKLLYEYSGLRDDICGFSLANYEGWECLYICSNSGEVLSWKTSTRYKVVDTEKDIPRKNIESFHMLPSDDVTKQNAIISYTTKGFVRFSIVNIVDKSIVFNLHLKLKHNDAYSLDISKSRFLSVVQKNKVYFQHLTKFETNSNHGIHESRHFTCVACHPNEEVVLTGDSSGRVIVWQNIFETNKSQSVFHWHTLPVNCVGFSNIGSYFYSGGDECVLVKWQFDNPNQKQFVPRLADCIQHVSVSNNNLLVAVSTKDNAIRILDSRLDLVALIQHLVLGNQFDSGIIYDSRTKSLVLNGNVGCVQFYSPTDKSLLYNIEITSQNKITNERNCVISNTEITNIALNKSCLWLATIEERKDDLYSMEVRLKFWFFNSEKQIFQLNTSIEYPHESSVNSIAFQPDDSDEDLRCCTVGNDKLFKVWQLVQADTIYKKGQAWKCLTSCYYRDLPCRSLSFSTDGSLIAIAFDNLLTVWTSESCELKTVLSHSYHKEKLKHIQFGNGKQNYFVVAASNNQLSVWNLLTMMLTWTVRINNISILIADPFTNNMAVFTKDTRKLFVFEPVSEDLIFSSNTILEDKEVIAATFVPKDTQSTKLTWCRRSNLYFITKEKELFCLGRTEEQEAEDTYEVYDRSLFSSLIPISKSDAINKLEPKSHLYEENMKDSVMKNYLEAPIQTLPPIRLTCFSLLKSMVLVSENDLEAETESK